MSTSFTLQSLRPGVTSRQSVIVHNTLDSEVMGAVEFSNIHELLQGSAQYVSIAFLDENDAQLPIPSQTLAEFQHDGNQTLSTIPAHADRQFILEFTISKDIDLKYQLKNVSFDITTGVEKNVVSEPSPSPTQTPVPSLQPTPRTVFQFPKPTLPPPSPQVLGEQTTQELQTVPPLLHKQPLFVAVFIGIIFVTIITTLAIVILKKKHKLNVL
ncbi:MAG TPA: hypothetical protein DCX25_02765 [Candidatus Pacebacteria bacterium]|nr:MAG: hypothetical protein UX00_C0004G0024 [Microgenomates group bacterium GW2011_GWB1_45_17]KKU23978.1 MAG: hypothetical protein UX35_C0003G0114 [Microgenomates group bacterium GW2011_GWA1_46_15]KKU24629.1 MAG: hypothetical protein UX36_C0001G0246 [Microgenomates group bacterium GW2011_GWC1_46_15]HAV15226.1 hypothetical protein [Candidatus Paceibacterota bacterium]HCR10941.1 hypothetical protein [Candidatus Paceibacterota bacterium]